MRPTAPLEVVRGARLRPPRALEQHDRLERVGVDVVGRGRLLDVRAPRRGAPGGGDDPADLAGARVERVGQPLDGAVGVVGGARVRPRERVPVGHAGVRDDRGGRGVDARGGAAAAAVVMAQHERGADQDGGDGEQGDGDTGGAHGGVSRVPDAQEGIGCEPDRESWERLLGCPNRCVEGRDRTSGRYTGRPRSCRAGLEPEGVPRR